MLNKVKKHSKKSHYPAKFLEYKDNARLLWKTVNSVICRENNKDTIIEKFNVNGIEYHSPLDIANLFGEYFSSIGNKYSEKYP